MDLVKLFIAFLKTGILGFGGGQAMIPLIENETVTRYALISTNDFIKTVTLANALPGPIATKLAVSIGFETAGLMGSLIALIGVILPSSIGIIVVFQLLDRFNEIAFIQGVQLAAKPLAAAFIIGVGITLVISLGQSLGWEITTTNTRIALIFIGVLIVYLVSAYSSIQIPTVLIVVLTLLMGGLLFR